MADDQMTRRTSATTIHHRPTVQINLGEISRLSGAVASKGVGACGAFWICSNSITDAPNDALCSGGGKFTGRWKVLGDMRWSVFRGADYDDWGSQAGIFNK